MWRTSSGRHRYGHSAEPAEDSFRLIDAADFGFTDPNDTPPNNFLAVKITTLPTNGTLTLFNGATDVAVHAGDFISVNEFSNGTHNLKYVPRPPTPTT